MNSNQITHNLVKSLFKDETGKPILLTPTQCKIFELIYRKQYSRNHIMAHTRFGKSLVVALAVLLRVATYPEKWALVAPSERKAKIIMSYIIQHVFDNSYTKSKLEIGDESIDRLRRERSKNRLNFKHSDGTLGEVYILSADSRNRQNAGDALMGFGAPHVVLDEAALIDDDIEAKIFRMLGDSMDNFYFKIGNPFRRNHFLRDSLNPKWHRINADYRTGLSEGRLSESFIEEVRNKPHFGVLYENKFPAADAIDDKGWSFLVTDKEYELAHAKLEPEAMFGEKMLGVDVARGGGNYNAWVMRCKNYTKLLAKNQDGDLMSVTGQTIRLAKENGINMRNVCVDDTGVGAGVFDRLREQKFYVKSVKLGERALNPLMFLNKRAECYWKMKEWLMAGGKLCSDDDWSEILNIKYKANSSGLLQIMPKEEMARMGIESPDVADALMLTFSNAPYVEWYQKEQEKQEAIVDSLNKYDLF